MRGQANGDAGCSGKRRLRVHADTLALWTHCFLRVSMAGWGRRAAIVGGAWARRARNRGSQWTEPAATALGAAIDRAHVVRELKALETKLHDTADRLRAFETSLLSAMAERREPAWTLELKDEKQVDLARTA